MTGMIRSIEGEYNHLLRTMPSRQGKPYYPLIGQFRRAHAEKFLALARRARFDSCLDIAIKAEDYACMLDPTLEEGRHEREYGTKPPAPNSIPKTVADIMKRLEMASDDIPVKVRFVTPEYTHWGYCADLFLVFDRTGGADHVEIVGVSNPLHAEP